MTEVNNAAPADELIEITSIPQFAAMVAGWHANVLAQLQQGIDVPDDVVISIGLKDGEPEVDLDEGQRAAFKAGLLMALAVIEELPFQGIADPVPETVAGGDEEGTGQ